MVFAPGLWDQNWTMLYPIPVPFAIGCPNTVFQQEVSKTDEGYFHGNFMKITVNKTVRIVLETYPGLLSALDDHLGTWSSHRLEMIKKVAAMFLTIRIKHSCRKKNEKKPQVRKVLSKQILFRHQWKSSFLLFFLNAK